MFQVDALIEITPEYVGLLAVDLDRDGAPELVLYGERLTIWKWTSRGPVDVTPRRLLPDDHEPISEIRAADFYGDGTEQLLIRTLNQVFLIASGPSGELRCGTIPIRLRGSIQIWDRRGHGRYSFTCGTQCFELESRKLIERFDLIRTDRLTEILALGAILPGGRADLLARMPAGNLGLHANQGTAGLQNVSTECGVVKLNGAAEHTLLIDSTTGERAGLLLADREAGHRLFLPDYDGVYKNRTPPTLAWPVCVSHMLAHDFDHDGCEELLLASSTDPSRWFRLPEVRPLVADHAELSMHDAVAVDLDQDGKLELVALIDSSCVIFKPTTTGNMIRIDPRTRFGAPARGVLVAVETNSKGRVMYRRIQGRCEPVAHFGLPDGERVIRVIVHRSDGSRSVVSLPGVVNQHITVHDSSR